MDNSKSNASTGLTTSYAFDLEADLLKELNNRRILITGVVTKSEIGKDRKQTILSVAVAQPEQLVLLVKGGADSFVGRVVFVDCDAMSIRRDDYVQFPMTISSTLFVPPGLVEAGIALPKPLPAPEVTKIREKMKPTPYDGLSDIDAARLRKFHGNGFKIAWSERELLGLIRLLSGKDKNEAIHRIAVMAMERAEKTRDCGSLARLINELSEARGRRLKAWVMEYSPIAFRQKKGRISARIQKNSAGEERPFQIARARYRPFFDFA